MRASSFIPRRPLWVAAALWSLALIVVGCSNGLPPSRPLPPGKTFAGLWDTNWGRMRLRQHGSRVSGQYKGFRNGAVSGEAKGTLLLFGWTQLENRQFGRGYLSMSADGEHLEGRWGYQKDRIGGGRWWANRAQE